jgi:hypothetical protein
MNDREYTEGVRKSMSEPFKPLNRIVLRPFYTSKADNQPSHRPGRDRRATGILMRLRRFWWHWSEDIGMFLWMIAIVMMAAGTIWIYGISR